METLTTVEVKVTEKLPQPSREIDFARIRLLQREEEQLHWKLERAIAKATKTTASISGEPRGSRSGNLRENQMIEVAISRDELKEVQRELKELRSQLKSRLRILTNINEKKAIRRRYLMAYSISEIMDSMCYSKSQVIRYLKRAEKRINSA